MIHPNNKIKLGMVGGGQGAFIGAIHRIAARIDDQYTLVAGALSSDPKRALESGLQLNIDADRCYSDYSEMARRESERPDGIDAVSIVTPNHLHYPVACAFIDAGIHVICDKPMTINLADALDLKKRAQAKGVHFLLTHNYSGYPLIRAARALIEQGDLGDLRVIQVEYAQDWLSMPLEEDGNKQAAWRTNPAMSGPAGCLGDIGTHAAQLAEYVTGLTPSELSAELTTFVPGRRVDDHVQVMLRYATGARGMLWASQVATGEENHLRLRVYGTKASISWDQEQPNTLIFQALGKPAMHYTRGMPGLPDVAYQGLRTPGGHPEGYLEAFSQIYTDFAAVLRGEMINATLPGLDDGIKGLAFIENVIKSSQNNGQWTPFSY